MRADSVVAGGERGHRGAPGEHGAAGRLRPPRRVRLSRGRGTPGSLERISGALEGLTVASDSEVPSCVAEVGVLADELHLHGLAEWAGQMWEAVMRDDAQGARSMGRTFRHTIVAQATEELAAAAGRRGRRETAVRPADPAGPPAAATTTLYARVIVTLSFVAALGAVALVLAYIVGRYSMVVFGQLFR